jgi:hypothetical protein
MISFMVNASGTTTMNAIRRAGAKRVLAAALCAAMVIPATAATLYKSVGPGGVIQFSDIPPDNKSVILEQRSLPSADTQVAQLTAASLTTQAVDPTQTEDSIARANAQVDQAEHMLAQARRPMWSDADGLRLETARADRGDYERVEFYKRSVLAARQMLMETLRNRFTR